MKTAAFPYTERERGRERERERERGYHSSGNTFVGNVKCSSSGWRLTSGCRGDLGFCFYLSFEIYYFII